jgi:hypothetical protein
VSARARRAGRGRGAASTRSKPGCRTPPPQASGSKWTSAASCRLPAWSRRCGKRALNPPKELDTRRQKSPVNARRLRPHPTGALLEAARQDGGAQPVCRWPRHRLPRRPQARGERGLHPRRPHLSRAACRQCRRCVVGFSPKWGESPAIFVREARTFRVPLGVGAAGEPLRNSRVGLGAVVE